MRGFLQRVGSSIMVVLRAEAARRLGLAPGRPVEVEDLEEGILVRPARTLDERLAGQARWGHQ